MLTVHCHDCNPVIINDVPFHETGCRGSLIFTKSKKQFELFRVFHTEGTEDEGVFDSTFAGSVFIPFNASDSLVFRLLRKAGYLGKNTHNLTLMNGLVISNTQKFRGQIFLKLEKR